ncbi:MAG: YceD family protein [Candidatus Omnitrophota bacterium]
MKIQIRNIADEGTGYEETVSPQQLEIPRDALRCLGPVRIEATFYHLGDEVVGKFSASGRYGLTCSRCLKDYEAEKENSFECAFDVEKHQDYIEFGSDIREELIVANSAFALCREDCRGLCPGCGADLNSEKCTCETGNVKRKTRNGERES